MKQMPSLDHQSSMQTKQPAGSGYQKRFRKKVAWVLTIQLGIMLLGGAFQSGQSSDDALFIDKEGRIGIGTTNPEETLEVAGSTKLSGPVGINRTAAKDQHLSIKPDKDQIPLNVTDPSGAKKWLTVTAGGNVIMNGGNLGLGTTDPAAKLEVTGNAQLNGPVGINRPPIDNQHLVIQPAEDHIALNVTDPSGTTNRLTVTSGGNVVMNGGNVGIGTAAPEARLDVAGDARIRGKVTRYARYQRDDEPEGFYEISPRYHLSLTGVNYAGRTRTIPQDTLKALCADSDGCQVRLAMTRWGSDVYTESASVFFTFYYSEGNGRWRASATDAGNASGIDGDNKTQHVRILWGKHHTCFFTDGIYDKYNNQGDGQRGMQLLVWNGHKNINRTCELTLID
jgi:hypothetical protein